MLTDFDRAISSYGLTEDHLAAIGAVCVSWSMLESQLNAFLSCLLPPEDKNTFAIFMGTCDFRTKIELTRALAHERLKDRKVFDRLDAFLNTIDMQLRPERNRFVHDMWLTTSPVPEHVNLKPRYIKTPYKPRELKVEFKSTTTVDEVREFAALVAWFGQMFYMAMACHRADLSGDGKPWPDIFASPLDLLNQYLDRRSPTPPTQP